MPAAPGFELGVEAEIDQRVLRIGRHDEDRAAPSAIPAVGAAARYELLAPEAQAPGAAVAGGDVDVHLVDEHLYQYRGWMVERRVVRPALYTTGMTEILRPCLP